MSGNIRVSPEQLQSLAAAVSAQASAIEQGLGTLRARIAPLAGGDWAGPAAGQFIAMWDQWQRAAGDLNHALQGISVLLGRAGQAYAHSETAIASSFRG
ncbi:MAG: WXG100 family type VII secretion target [Sporichthyaceae bacterium]|nr:WXG100 family type VII secretion target [Sporichthyaceae bacterium]